MAYLSVDFLLLLLGALFAFHAVHDARWRTAVLLVSSALFLGSFARAPAELGGFGAFLALGYGLIGLARRRPPGAVFAATVVLYLVAFAYLRRYSALEALPQWREVWVTAGLSYVLFRVLHLMVDAFENEEQPAVGPVAYLLYTCSWLTFVSGPIQRFEEHRAQVWKLGAFTLDDATVRAGLSRILNGVLKVALVSALLQRAHGWGVEQLVGAPSALALAYTALGYTLFLYANFSGSIDIVLGAGALFGFQLPENFVRPFESGNLLELWSRWHITLSQWFKVYVFNPLLKFWARWLKSPKAMVYGGVAGYFVTFLLMGAWHGTTFAYVLYGAVLGAGAAATKLYDVVASKRLGKKPLAALRERRLYVAAARGFTLSYFSLALALWWLPLARAASLGAATWLVAFFALGLAAAVAHLAWAAGAQITSRLPAPTSLLGAQLWLAARAFAIAALAFDSSFHVPELIYKGF